MGRHPTRPRKFEREIEHHRRLYEHRELSRVADNWIFYWRFLAHLQDRDYRPRTVGRYHQMLRSFLSWLDGRSLRRVVREDIERYLLYRKAERQRVAYTIRYTREVLSAFFQWLMQYCPIEVNPAAGLRIRIYYPQPGCGYGSTIRSRSGWTCSAMTRRCCWCRRRHVPASGCSARSFRPSMGGGRRGIAWRCST